MDAGDDLKFQFSDTSTGHTMQCSNCPSYMFACSVVVCVQYIAMACDSQL